MSSTNAVLTQKSLVIIFVYVPTGLGHLRVTDALYHGLSEGTNAILLGAQEKSASFIHRLLSIHPLLRRVMVLSQRGFFEDLFTYFYRLYLRSKTDVLYKQLETILSERLDVPNRILVIATHYVHAYQIAALKERFEKEKMVKISLVVQVTDDSPLDLWYVEGADLIFVPSDKTRDVLVNYGRKSRLKEVNFEVNAYPVSPLLSEHLSSEAFEQHRAGQLISNSRTKIHMAIPISGAAVGTDFFTVLIDSLHRASDRFIFSVVAKTAPYTQKFISLMMQRTYVELKVSSHDRGVVDLYEQVYKTHPISLEVTKPSEQSFKALLTPRQRGGSLLLFATPVGRQEYDNLDFLRRHHLIPQETFRNSLWNQAEKNLPLKDVEREGFQRFRGVELPEDPQAAARFILWCLKFSVFSQMVHFSTNSFQDHEHEEELNSHGVKDFWTKVATSLTSFS